MPRTPLLSAVFLMLTASFLASCGSSEPQEDALVGTGPVSLLDIEDSPLNEVTAAAIENWKGDFNAMAERLYINWMQTSAQA